MTDDDGGAHSSILAVRFRTSTSCLFFRLLFSLFWPHFHTSMPVKCCSLEAIRPPLTVVSLCVYPFQTLHFAIFRERKKEVRADVMTNLPT